MKNKGFVLMDGAVGTSLWAKTENKVPVWRYNVENPEIVRELHKEMADAGAEIVLTNTFGANRPMLKKAGYKVENIIREGIRLCRESIGDKAKCAFSVGPLPGLMDPYGDVTYEEAVELYTEIIDAGMKEQPDIIYLQTFMDITMMSAAAECARKYDIPLFCSMSFEKVGKTMMGNSIDDMLTELEPFKPDAVGLNCNLVPEVAINVLKMFKKATSLPLIFKPNSGKPILQANGESSASLSADAFVEGIIPAIGEGASYIGGCCGTSPEYIKKLHDTIVKM